MEVTKIDAHNATLFVPPSEVRGIQLDGVTVRVRVWGELYRLGVIDGDEDGHATNALQSLWADKVDTIDLTADGVSSGEERASDDGAAARAVAESIVDHIDALTGSGDDEGSDDGG